MHEKTIKIVVTGLVQGVFYRKFVKENADLLGLKGTVRNLSDGGVEAICSGDKKLLNKFIEKLKIGPELSKVKKVNVKEISTKPDLNSFKITY